MKNNKKIITLFQLFFSFSIVFWAMQFLPAHADTILVGSDGANYNTSCWGHPAATLENCHWKTSRYQAKNSGTISYFRMRVGVTPTGCTHDSGCWAIYEAGTNSSVGALKAYNCFTNYNWTTIGQGWHNFPVANTVTNLNITAGNYYWLVFHSYAVDSINYANAGCSAYIPAYRGNDDAGCISTAGMDFSSGYAGKVETQCSYSSPPAPAAYDVPVQTYVMWGIWSSSEPPADVTPPQVTNFTISPTNITVGSTITANYTVTDNVNLAQAELWRAPYNATNCNETNKTGCAWGTSPIQTRTISGTTNTGTITDTPPVGTYMYGLHVRDAAGNWATEATSIRVTVNGVASTTPAINNISGTTQHGQNITISGSDFGTKNPAPPLWWDDGEGANVDNPSIMKSGEMSWATSTLSGSGKHYSDAWPNSTADTSTRMQYRSIPRRDTPAPHSRSTKYLTGCHDDQGECLGGEVGQNVGLTIGDFSRHSTWYVSYFLRLDSQWPTDGTTQNYKFANWEMGAPRSTMYSSPFCYDNVNGCNGVQRATPGCNYDYWSGSSVTQIINTTTCTDGWTSPNFGAPFVTHNSYKNNPLKQWVKQEHVLDYNSDKYWFGVDNNEFWDTANKAGCTFNKQTYSNAPSGVTIGGFWKQSMCSNLQDDLNDNACRYFDDVYVDNTFSRIVLANNANYDNATIIEPQIPQSWADGSATVKVNGGKINDGQQAYLFVFDSNNQHNAVGYPVTLGGPTPITGDLNADNLVNIFDIQLSANVAAGTETNPDIVARADVNADGQRNIFDIQIVANLAAGG